MCGASFRHTVRDARNAGAYTDEMFSAIHDRGAYLHGGCDCANENRGINMRISIIKRLRITCAFWRALGVKDCDVAMALVHEYGPVSITSWNMRAEPEECNYEYKTTRPD